MTEEPPASTTGHPVAMYTALRVLIFAVPFGVLLLLGLNLVWALLISAIASSIASLFVLNRQRDQMSISISNRSDRMRQRMAEREASEDAWDDERREGTDEGESDGPASSTGPGSP